MERYEHLTSGTKEIESNMQTDFIEHLNVEIALGAVKCEQDVFEWVKTTFMFIRMIKLPEFYLKKKIIGHQNIIIEIKSKTI